MRSSSARNSKASNSESENTHSSRPFISKKGEGGLLSESNDVVEPFIRPQAIQAKLSIGKPNDKYEQEADSMADKVVQKFNSSNQSPVSVQKMDETPDKEEEIQKKDSDEEVNLSLKSDSGGKSQSGGPNETSSRIESQLQNSRGSGQAMDPETKSGMEQSFGSDFSDVNIHTGSNAVQMNRELGAKAFANGNDIYFNEGQYKPSSKEGQHLLAHELTHTIQQGGGKGIAQTKNNIQLSPLSDELSQLWADQGKGAFYDRLRQVSPLSDPDLIPFVNTLHGDDLWLTQNIIVHGRESGWPIHLKVQREMKGWADSGGKGVVFDLLRTANGTENGNMELHFALNGIFEAGTDDIWLANNLIAHGVEANWPIHLRVEREMKGWGDSGGKGVVFDILRTANGSESSNAQLSASLAAVFEAGSQDIWLANLLQQHGIEANWPIQLKIQRDLKGWADSGGFAAVIVTIRAATVPERQTAVADAEVLTIVHSSLSQAEGTAVISELLVGSQNWDNPPATDFYTHFVLNNGSGAIPTTRTMNCWESILYSAHLAGHVTAAWIKNYYVSAGAIPNTTINPTPALWAQLGFSTGLPTHDPVAGRVPSLGQLVFYLPTGASIPSHVAVAAGNGEVISLWTRPNNISSIQRIPITSISGTIYYGNTPW